MPIFCIKSVKKLHRPKKIYTDIVCASVTNMRYVQQLLKLIDLRNCFCWAFCLWVLNTNLYFVFVRGELGAVFAPSFTLHRTATAHKLKMKAAFLRWCATTLCRRRISEEYRVCPRWPLSYKKVCLWQLQASHHWPFYHDEPALKQRPSSSGLLIAEV